MKKKLSLLMLTVGVICTALVFTPVNANAKKVTRPPQVQNVAYSKTGNDSVRITWNPATFGKLNDHTASGYNVYLKTGSSNYKKLYQTTNTFYDIGGLKHEVNYMVKVRAYNTHKGKKYYGKMSEPLSFQINYEQDYLSSLMDATFASENSMYYKYSGDSVYFYMADSKCYNGYKFYADGSYVPFTLDLGQKYSKVSFNIGLTDDSPDYDTNFKIFTDGNLVQTVSYKESGLPVSVTVDTSNVKKFEIVAEGGFVNRGDHVYVGISDMIGYY